MADFRTHITTSTTLGIAYGVAAWSVFEVPLPHCLVAGALCGIGGMLPDLDSDSGVPQREMLCFVSVLIPMLMLPRFMQLGWSPEGMVFAAGLIYVLIRFGIGNLFRQFTRHRGMWHSIPAAMIAGLSTYLVGLSPETSIRVFKAWAVVLGFLSHLLLDEIYSVDLNGRKIKVKKSFGSALKWTGKRWTANLFTWGTLAALVALTIGDHRLMQPFNRESVQYRLATWKWQSAPPARLPSHTR
jgi:membrane-bound metal-dependent hydrolase YbcI (DUF457 family)